MEKIRKYRILPEERLVLEYLKGKVAWSEYMDMKKEEIANSLYSGAYDVITDIKDVHTDFTLEIEKEIINYVEYLSQQNMELKHRASVITNTPKQLLHAEFFKIKGRKLPIKTKTFSTYKSALDYLQIKNEKHQIVINHLEEMKLGIH